MPAASDLAELFDEGVAISFFSYAGLDDALISAFFRASGFDEEIHYTILATASANEVEAMLDKFATQGHDASFVVRAKVRTAFLGSCVGPLLCPSLCSLSPYYGLAVPASDHHSKRRCTSTWPR